MNEDLFPLDEFDDSALSEEDREVLRAFAAIETWPSTTLPPTASTQSVKAEQEDLDMLLIFTAEAEEDITTIRAALQQAEQHEPPNRALFSTMQRAGHKLRGTAGAVGFPFLSTIAYYIEAIGEQVTEGRLQPLHALEALSPTVTALEECLSNITVQGKELDDPTLLAALKSLYQNMDIALEETIEERSPAKTAPKLAPSPAQEQLSSPPIAAAQEGTEPEEEAVIAVHIPANTRQEQSQNANLVRIDAQRFENLLLHMEQLVEQRTALDNAQAQVETAMQELHAAQVRLQQLEAAISTTFISNPPPKTTTLHTSSSLIARILHQSEHHDFSYQQQRRLRLREANAAKSIQWDELDIERYTEKDLLLQSLRDAIADITVTTSLAQTAHKQQALLQQEYINHVETIRSDALLLHQAPFSTLLPRLQRVVTMSQAQQIDFEVEGATTEIDQELLDALAAPLVQLLRTCIADTITNQDQAHTQAEEKPSISLQAHSSGSEITLKIGFSMTVRGGALETFREAIQQLQGTLTLERNTAGGISWILHFPRSHRAVQCLLVHTANQQLIVPFSQIRRVVDGNQETLEHIYDLNTLLGFPLSFSSTQQRVQPTLVIHDGALRREVGITVDEVIGEIELVVKPLKSYLQRPGIIGTAVDGKGCILLMVDIASLLRKATNHSPVSNQAKNEYGSPNTLEQLAHPSTQRRPKILVADDSAYLRLAVQKTLQHTRYVIIEARDGMETLEMLLEHRPDICLLDVEMPNLNGYDVLTEIRQHPELGHVKVIMLTSRSADKHLKRAFELGARAYLTKPCSQEALLSHIEQVLAS